MYQQYFGFLKKPFAVNVSPADLFKCEQYVNLHKRFEYICKHRGMMLLTGSPGTGKTTAIRALLSDINRNLYLPVYLPLSTVSVFEFYRQLNMQLGGQEAYYKTDIFKSIQDQILGYASNRNITPVIVLDEAHLLKEQNFKELQIIINFKMDSYMPAVFILSGQPFLAKRVQSYALESFNQRISLRYELGLLTRQDCKEYVNHHLTVAGRSDRIISNPGHEAIFNASRGVPRIVGRVVVTALRKATENNRQTIDENDILEIKNEVM